MKLQPMKSPNRHSASWRAALTLLLPCVLFIPWSRAADVNPPEKISYQGFLADANGVVLGNDSPRNYTAIFRIYAVSTGGDRLWAEQQTITVDKGYFSVLLGEGSQVTGEPRLNLSSIFTGASASDRYIGITVRGLAATDVEIAPRLQLLAAPYSFLARNAVSLVNDQGTPFVNITSGTLAAIGIGAPVQSTGSGGNARGGKAVDLQLTRDGATQVASGDYSTIAGGRKNTASAVNSTVGGGEANRAAGVTSTVSGGSGNQATGNNASIGGGAGNVASGEGATVAGGSGNTASGWRAFIGSGEGNTASGGASVVPGGYSNSAIGADSFAAGRRARANHNGSFVWADSTDADYGTGAVNQFRVRATGGVLFAGPASTTPEAARQFVITDNLRNSAISGLNLGYQYNPGVEAAGVIQAYDGGSPARLKLNPRGGDVVVGGTLVANGGFGGGGTIPLGGIIMWSGAISAIPSGWALCNGQTVSGRATPDLRDKFVVGAGSAYGVGAQGGSASVTLTANQMPAHSHSYKDTVFSEHSSVSGPAVDPDFAGNNQLGSGWSDRDNSLRYVTRTTAATGVNQAFDVRPPYYALAYIMRVQ